MADKEALFAHLQTGATTTCRAWKVTRQDGTVFGFTDHDRDLAFDGITFLAETGLTPGALQQTRGLAVDNTEIVGALSADSITEDDLRAGRYDGAEVMMWLVNWRELEQRQLRFRGHFGEIQVKDGTFRVDLRGLSERLNQSRGRLYQPSCSAALGDAECRFNLDQAPYTVETIIKDRGQHGEYFVPSQSGVEDGWFTWGRIEVLDGIARGMTGAIRADREIDGRRRLLLMTEFTIRPEVGDTVRFHAGCDREAATCRVKFANFLNFRGFPHVPGTDWQASYPVANQRNDGGSRQS